MMADFFSGFFLWRDAMAAAITVAILCGWLGVYVVLKRIVFVSAALPQTSGFGIALSFFIGSYVGPHAHSHHLILNPLVMALIFSCSAAALFSLNINHRRLASETVIGLGYVFSAAMVLEILNSPRIVQEAHEIGDVLFGNAVVIELSTLYVTVIAAGALLLIHLILFRKMVMVLFDPEMAATLGVRVRFYNLVFYLTVAVAVSVATKAIGALPVFGFMVIPPAASLMMARTLKGSILMSIAIGIFAAVVGYITSYIFSYPTGATMVGIASVWLLPGLLMLPRKT